MLLSIDKNEFISIHIERHIGSTSMNKSTTADGEREDKNSNEIIFGRKWSLRRECGSKNVNNHRSNSNRETDENMTTCGVSMEQHECRA